MKRKTKFLMCSVTALGTFGIFLSSCGHAQPLQKSEFDNKVVIQTSQNQFYPLMWALSEIVDLYNKQFRDTPGFLPVELQQSEKTNATSELQLTNKVVASIQANSQLVPNIILADLNAAYKINGFDRLLDLSNNPIINENYFDSDIYNNFNKVSGASANDKKVYAIPFNLTTTDSLVFNKPVMNLLFKLVTSGGGTVDRQSKIYKELQMDQTDMGRIPNKKWKDLEVKDANVYKGLTVNDDTFSNLESMFEFSKKITDGLKLKQEPTVTGQQRDLKVFMLDYGPNIYQKYLWSKLGNSRDTWLWNFKLKNNQFDLDFTNLEKTQGQETIGTTYDFFKSNYSTLSLNDNQLLKSIYFGTGGTSDWTSWDIRNFDTAFGIAPHVGWNQSVLSPFTIKTFRANKGDVSQEDINNAKTNFASASEILWKTQLTKFDKENPNKNTFWIGGSSLIGIKTSKHRDEQTKKFLEWLFNDTIIKVSDSPFNGQSISQILNSVSAYDLTSKQALSTSAQQALEQTIANEQKEVDKVKDNPTPETFNNPAWSRIYLNKGALASLTDWLTFKTELNKDPNNNSIAFINTDEKASKILSIINAAISGITQSAEPTNLTKENLIKQIKDDLAANN
ncbi:P68 family surface lipoprotein [[Mycoplasma] imitans]|uniref:P68 family surface lipoprotein n=1 Tax=[Mycoplasma] imitans TaxID=29560 RepID=UPI00048370E1|nr:P80 family lipoprotein [[Mycoplasma] imitans]